MMEQKCARSYDLAASFNLRLQLDLKSSDRPIASIVASSSETVCSQSIGDWGEGDLRGYGRSALSVNTTFSSCRALFQSIGCRGETGRRDDAAPFEGVI